MTCQGTHKQGSKVDVCLRRPYAIESLLNHFLLTTVPLDRTTDMDRTQFQSTFTGRRRKSNDASGMIRLSMVLGHAV